MKFLKKRKWIFCILFFAYCTGGDLYNTVEVSKGQSAPLLETQEIIEAQTKQLKAFQWRLEIPQTDYQTIKGKADNPSNRKALLSLLKDPNNVNGIRIFAMLKLMSFDLHKKRDQEAAKLIEEYSDEFPDLQEDFTKLVTLLKEKREAVQAIDLGKSVNTFDSYLPIPELSGKKIYYTSMYTPGGRGGEDVLEVTIQSGAWTSLKFLHDLNTSGHDSVCSISADGTRLILFGNYSNTLGRGDLFYSNLTEKGWSSPKNFGEPINSREFDSDGFFTPDGKALLFTSDRDGGYFPFIPKGVYNGASLWGNTDIYVSFIQEDGSFGIPINLGPIINTPGAERTPFLHPDGKTLYFSSNGHNVNLGDMDIYKSVRLDDSWTNWSVPENIGKELNTSGTDWGFKLTAASELAYMSKFNVDKNRENIYSFSPLPKRAKPEERVTAIEGRILDENGQPLEADIEWENLNSSKPLGKLRSKPITGEFFITLPSGEVYVYFARKSGYLSESQSIDLSNEKTFQTKKIEITLISIRQASRSGGEIVLGNILFESDSAVLDKRSYPEVDRLYKVLVQNPELKIEIQGHTSTGRTEEFNLHLSEERANAIVAYLIEKGIKPDRLAAKGYGSSVPLVENTNEEKRKRNRRVSFKILEGNE